MKILRAFTFYIGIPINREYLYIDYIYNFTFLFLFIGIPINN